MNAQSTPPEKRIASLASLFAHASSVVGPNDAVVPMNVPFLLWRRDILHSPPHAVCNALNKRLHMIRRCFRVSFCNGIFRRGYNAIQ